MGAQYPGQVWDGRTPRRPTDPLLRSEVPDYPDYDQLVAEIRATQQHLNDQIFGSNFTSIAITVPSFMTVTGSPLTVNGTIGLDFQNDPGFLKYDGFHEIQAADLPTHTHSGNDIDSGIIAGTFLEAFAGSDPGAVPSSGPSDQSKFLRGDGLWADPASSSGTVTSVGLSVPSILSVTGSPITTSGTLALALTNQNAHLVFAGPGAGAAASPTFRLLVAGDLPTHQHDGGDITSGTVGRAFLQTMVGAGGSNGSSGAVPQPLIADSGKYLRGDATWAVPPQGTVTSIALSAPSILSVGGSPITSSGTIALSLATQNANRIFAGPSSGGAAAPTFRVLTSDDLPSHVHSAVDITSGTLDAARLPTMVGDSGTGGTKGAVPAPVAGDATKFLRGDATWATPSTNPGTVTSVAISMPSIFGVSGSPITTSGTLTVTLGNQSANTFLAGPSAGGAATPSFRILAAADLPTHAHSGSDITSGVISGSYLAVMTGATAGSDGAQGVVPQPLTGEQAKFLRGDGTWANPSSGGTVTSVALATPAIFSVSGSPVTTSGTLTFSVANQTANTVWAGPGSGSAAAPSFRALVANDLPTHVHDGAEITSGTVGAAYLGVMTGDSGSGGAKGAVPPPISGDATKFLRGDATWANPNVGLTSVALSTPSELTVSGSPLTANGTITISKSNQSANTVWAGPTSGGANTPSFRLLVAGDLPTHSHTGGDITSGTVAGSYLGVMVGDSGSGGTKGAVPAPGTGDASKFLRGDATWATPSTGVTSVALALPSSILTVSGSPVTTTGTLTGSLANQNANKVWAGPTSGGDATPTFRALVAADLPTHNHSGADITSGTVAAARLGLMTGDSGSGGASGAVPAPSTGDAAAGRFLAADATWKVPSGLATVTSVALALPGSVFSISGSPVTTSGTLTGAFTTQTANTIFAGPTSGGAATPAFRAIVAADLPVMVGDSGSGGTKGAVPAPATGDATKFLRGNATWSTVVTSVAMTVPSILSISGSPVTTTGTLALTLANQTQNTVFAGSNGGGSVPPTFRALVPDDIPSLTKAKISDLETITTTSTASAIPKADGSGKIANAWLNTGTGNGLDADTVDGVHLSGLVQTSRTISAGTGLSGGGTLAADRSFALDINGLSAVTTYADADTIPIYSASAVKKIATNTLFNYKPVSQNYIINGAFRIFQRGGTSFTDDSYCLDRWYALTQTAAIGVSQVLAPTSFKTGSSCRLTQTQASAQRMGIAQIVESVHSYDLLLDNISLQFIAKASTSLILRSAIIGWSSTPNSPPSDVVNDWTSSTYTTNNFFINNANIAILSVQSHSLTTTAQSFMNELTWVGGSSYNNFIIVFWTESTAAQNVTVDISAVGLYKGQGARRYTASSMADEILNCQRFYQKSYEIGTTPITYTDLGSVGVITPVSYAAVSGGFISTIRTIDKVRTPSVSIYNVHSSGAVNSMRDITSGPKNVAASATNIAQSAFDVTMDASNYNAITAGDLLRFHWVADAEL